MFDVLFVIVIVIRLSTGKIPCFTSNTTQLAFLLSFWYLHDMFDTKFFTVKVYKRFNNQYLPVHYLLKGRVFCMFLFALTSKNCLDCFCKSQRVEFYRGKTSSCKCFYKIIL